MRPWTPLLLAVMACADPETIHIAFPATDGMQSMILALDGSAALRLEAIDLEAPTDRFLFNDHRGDLHLSALLYEGTLTDLRLGSGAVPRSDDPNVAGRIPVFDRAFINEIHDDGSASGWQGATTVSKNIETFPVRSACTSFSVDVYPVDGPEVPTYAITLPDSGVLVGYRESGFTVLVTDDGVQRLADDGLRNDVLAPARWR